MALLDNKLSRDEIFVVGGGPSLKGFLFERLRGRHTIAVNTAIIDVPEPKYFLTADTSYAKKAIKNKFWNVKTTKVLVTSPTHPCYDRVKDYLMEYDVVIKFSQLFDVGFEFNTFGTGRNSGFCAMQFALLLGYKKIYLLGFDLLVQGTDLHYHTRYGTTQYAMDSFFPNFVTGLENIRKNTSVEILSCSSISRLNQYIPFVSLEAALK